MVGSEHNLDYDYKSKTMDIYAVKHPIPGFSDNSEIKKASDDNLSPFMSYNSTPIQFGDTFLFSTSTDSPTWFPGDCLFLAKYEGKFKKKKVMLSSQVFLKHYQ